VDTGGPIPVATNTLSPRRSTATVDIIVSDPRQRGGRRVEWARSGNRSVPTFIPTTRRQRPGANGRRRTRSLLRRYGLTPLGHCWTRGRELHHLRRDVGDPAPRHLSGDIGAAGGVGPAPPSARQFRRSTASTVACGRRLSPALGAPSWRRCSGATCTTDADEPRRSRLCGAATGRGMGRRDQ
jgi:hypothetical protein